MLTVIQRRCSPNCRAFLGSRSVTTLRSPGFLHRTFLLITDLASASVLSSRAPSNSFYSSCKFQNQMLLLWKRLIAVESNVCSPFVSRYPPSCLMCSIPMTHLLVMVYKVTTPFLVPPACIAKCFQLWKEALMIYANNMRH